jgi:hypothetical protein
MGIQINGQTDTISASDGSLVVSGAELPTVGNINATGIITATTFSGDGSGLTGIDATQIVTGNTSVQTVDTGSDGHVKINTEGVERVRIDSSGQLGIGITTPAHKLHVTGGSLCVDGFANSASNYITLRSGFAPDASGGSGIKAVNNTAGNDDGLGLFGHDGLSLYTAQTERARIDPSGRLLVGATSSINDNEAGTGYPNKVQIESSSANNGLTVRNIGNVSRLNIVRLQNSMTSGTHVGYLGFGAHVASGPSIERARISGYTDTSGGAGGYGGQLRFEVSNDGSASVTERARIERNGRFSINYASVSGAINDYSGGIYSFHSSPNSNSTTLGDQRATWFIRGSVQNTNNDGANNILLLQDTGGAAINPGNMMRAYRGSTEVFRVSNDGSVRNNSGTYTTLSDERAKQDIIDASSAWDDVKSLRIRKFRLKSEVEHYAENPHLGDAPYFLGVIAQEVEQVCPNLVDSPKLDDGSPDPDALKGVKQSIIYMKAVKALQEAQERIETLETTIVTLSDRISALENP